MYRFFIAQCFFFITWPFLVSGQTKYPVEDFISPLDITLSVSGTFGELRNTHLHSGIDFRTMGVEGVPMRAVADGYVSRIMISPTGFGKAIYIHHPNGYTSVYGHCRNFTPEIDAYIRNEQYRMETFAVNLFPEAALFPVKQGDIIAYSGNTGSSQGPHLHFEIRKTNGQIPLNPLHFGFEVKDFIRPQIERLVIYPFGPDSRVEGKTTSFEPEIAGWGPVYRLKSGDTISVSGDIYFGIETYDRLNDSNNKNGVYSVEIFQDSNLVYAQKKDGFPFSETRYVMSLMDYPRFVSERKRIQRTRIEPSNRLSVYTKADNNGIFRFDENRVYTMQYVVKDAHANESVLTFYLRGSVPPFVAATQPPVQQTGQTILNWNTPNIFEKNGLVLEIPERALYDTVHFRFSVSPSVPGSYAPVYRLHHKYTALHDFCRLSVKPHAVPGHLMDKVLIAALDDGNFRAVGGAWDGDYLTARIRDFGDYTIIADTLAPEIQPINIYDGKDISSQSAIRIKTKDDLAGIETFRGTMNGEWILMEWDPKNDLLIYQIDDKTLPGNNDFRLTVSDTRGNEAIYEATLVR
jgi:hypothetical protein